MNPNDKKNITDILNDINEKYNGLTGFEMINELFSKLDLSRSLLTTKSKFKEHLVNLEWFDSKSNLPKNMQSTKPVSIETMQKAAAKLYLEKNPNYAIPSYISRSYNPEDSSQDKIKPEEILANELQLVQINVSLSRTKVTFLSPDFKIKLAITNQIIPKDNVPDADNPNKIKPTVVDIREFEEAIIDVLRDDDDKELFYEASIRGVQPLLNEKCKDLVYYYEYLLRCKEDPISLHCQIFPKRPLASATNKDGSDKRKARNSSIPFVERARILEDLPYYGIIRVNEKKLNGDIIPNSYTTYIYKDVFQNGNCNGYLFVSEPQNDNRATRIYYVSEHDYERRIQPKLNESKFESIVKENLEMTQSEFSEKGNVSLHHTSLDSYTDRLKFFVCGDVGKSITNYKKYVEDLKALYKNNNIQMPPRKLSSKDIGNLGITKTGNVDRTAQITMTTRNEQYKQK